MISPLSHRVTETCVSAERALLARLNGGCQVPLAGHARLLDDEIEMAAMIANPDGSSFIRLELSGPIDQAEAVGTRLAEKLLERGGREILANLGINPN